VDIGFAKLSIGRQLYNKAWFLQYIHAFIRYWSTVKNSFTDALKSKYAGDVIITLCKKNNVRINSVVLATFYHACTEMAICELPAKTMITSLEFTVHKQTHTGHGSFLKLRFHKVLQQSNWRPVVVSLTTGLLQTYWWICQLKNFKKLVTMWQSYEKLVAYFFGPSCIHVYITKILQTAQ